MIESLAANKDIIFANVFGAGIVFTLTKIHISYISDKLRGHDSAIEKVNDRLTSHTSDHKIHN